MNLLGVEEKLEDIVDKRMCEALGVSNSLGETVRPNGMAQKVPLASGTRYDYREMKLSFLSDLETVSEARTVSACLMFMSGFIACGQRLLHNIQGKEQGLRDSLSNIQNKFEPLSEK